MVKLSGEQMTNLGRAENMLAEAAGIIEDVKDEVSGIAKVAEDDLLVEQLDDAYESAYGGMCVVGNIRLAESAKQFTLPKFGAKCV